MNLKTIVSTGLKSCWIHDNNIHTIINRWISKDLVKSHLTSVWKVVNFSNTNKAEIMNLL